LMSIHARELAGVTLYLDPATTTYDLQTRDAYYRDNGVVTQELLPAVAATPEETEILNMHMPDIQKYDTESFANWITGNGDIDAEWENYVKRMYDMGLQSVLDVYQAQYDRCHEK
ncbi:MAG: hypothetical protein RR482_08075, partial [Clostridia bacterium]